MDARLLSLMTREHLEAYAKELDIKAKELSAFSAASSSEVGRLIVDSYHKDLSFVRAQYLKINTMHDHSACAIANLQGREQELLQQIDKLENIAKRKKELDIEAECVINELSRRNGDVSQETTGAIVSSAARSKLKR